MEDPDPDELAASEAAYEQIKAYFKGQDDPELPVPTTPEEAIDAVVRHRRWCNEELLAAALTVTAYLNSRIRAYLREHDDRTLALLDACQAGDWNRVSYTRIGTILGLSRQGAEQLRLRLRRASTGQRRDVAQARRAKPAKSGPQQGHDLLKHDETR